MSSYIVRSNIKKHAFRAYFQLANLKHFTCVLSSLLTHVGKVMNNAHASINLSQFFQYISTLPTIIQWFKYFSRNSKVQCCYCYHSFIRHSKYFIYLRDNGTLFPKFLLSHWKSKVGNLTTFFVYEFVYVFCIWTIWICHFVSI